MKIMKQKKEIIFVISLLMLQLAWVNISTASEELSQTIGTLRASRSVMWRDEVAPDKKLQEEFDVAPKEERFCQSLSSQYLKPSSVTCFTYRNMSENSDLMQKSRERQRLKLEQSRSEKIKFDEHVLKEIAEEERRQVLQEIKEEERKQKEMAEKLEYLGKLTEMPVVVKKVEEEVVAVDEYAQTLLQLCRCMGLK